MALHPNEPLLLFRGSTGLWLPTHDFLRLSLVAKDMGPAYSHALSAQADRQQSGSSSSQPGEPAK